MNFQFIKNKWYLQNHRKKHIFLKFKCEMRMVCHLFKVLALVTLPELLDDPKYPEDVKSRARAILAGCRGGSVGKLVMNFLVN